MRRRKLLKVLKEMIDYSINENPWRQHPLQVKGKIIYIDCQCPGKEYENVHVRGDDREPLVSMYTKFFSLDEMANIVLCTILNYNK